MGLRFNWLKWVARTRSWPGIGLPLLAAIILVTLEPGFVSANPGEATNRLLRVRLIDGIRKVLVAGTGPLVMASEQTPTPLAEVARGRFWLLVARDRQMDVFDHRAIFRGRFQDPVVVRPKSVGTRVWVNGKEYRGLVRIWPDSTGNLLVVNELDLESYLRGVVPQELGQPQDNAFEALKAQAVAARTYALSRQRQDEDADYHLVASTADQVYGGYYAETPTGNRAVAETRGIILTYQKQPIQAYYSSTCGGHTAAIEWGWRRNPVPYLGGVPDQDAEGRPFCQTSPFFSWTETWTFQQLQSIIARFLPQEDPHMALQDGERVTGLRVVERTPSGRVAILEIETTRSVFHIYGDRTRWVLRRSDPPFPLLRSSWFDLYLERNERGQIHRVVARGHGYGHGIGLCQTGALGMAQRGFSFSDILQHYYPGTQWQRLSTESW